MPAFDKNLQTLIGIMVFYALLTFLIFPVIGVYALKTFASNKNVKSDGIFYGMMVGALISIYLWKAYGSKMVK